MREESAAMREEESGSAKMAVLLDNIRSAWNTGSILRSADGFGFSHAYLCGITPSPETDAVQKTALGAEKFVSWSRHKDALQLIKRLKSEGWTIGALEEDRRAVALHDFRASRLQSPFALAVGNEAVGVDPEALDLADFILYIPMRGQKRSFNAASAFSIAAYALSRSFQ
jgi:tRNA G18 (ribose-2'-O)-methylase SpoU